MSKTPLTDRLMTPEAYREKFHRELTDGQWLHYFDRQIRRDGSTLLMLEMRASESVPGGAWPGNYGLVTITDYSTRMVRKGPRQVLVAPRHTVYEDWEGMDDLVPYDLPTTAQNIQRVLAKQRTAVYNLPHRFYPRFQDRLLCKINDTECEDSELNEEMLAEALAEMTPFERSKYEQAAHKIDVSLYPSVEQPVLVRIDGTDDGAEEALFADVASAMAALEDIAKWQSSDRRRHHHGFQGTD